MVDRAFERQGRTYEALRSCSTDPAEMEHFNNNVLSTYTVPSLRLNTEAIDSLLANQILLAEMDRTLVIKIRQHRLVLRDSLESLKAMTEPIERFNVLQLPIIKVDRNKETERPKGAISLAVPFSEACKNEKLLKHMYLLTVIWYPARGDLTRIEASINATLDALAGYDSGEENK